LIDAGFSSSTRSGKPDDSAATLKEELFDNVDRSLILIQALKQAKCLFKSSLARNERAAAAFR
jgi:hypothetical protein